jgi:tetratricopeptide (TPR) repeat protein
LPGAARRAQYRGMTARDRRLRLAVALLILLHLAAALCCPGALWGISQLAAWPLPLGIVWSALALVALVLWPARARRATPRDFPGPATSLLLALAACLLFALAHERSHFFGDGALLIRDHGDSESVTRAPLLVHATVAAVAGLERLGMTTAASLALLAVVAGGVGVFAALRLAAVLTADRGGRFLAASLLLGGGCMQLFCGHVEYYALVAAAVLLYMWIACRGLAQEKSLWPTWLVAGVLATVHLATVALVPAQALLGVTAWRRGERWRTALGMAGGGVIAMALLRLLGDGGASGLAGTALAGFHRYLAPYRDLGSARHAFGFFSGAHALAVCNDLLLVAPLAVVALPALGRRGLWRGADRVQRFLALASAGALAFSILFAREVGPYRDWDILATFGFVYLAWTAARWTRPHTGSQRAALVCMVVGGLHHTVPWVAMQMSEPSTLRHLQTVLATRSQWSPHARAYMHEEIAIWARQQGDLAHARSEYEAAVAANPADARYHVGLGMVLAQAGDLESAAVQFAIAVRQRPDYAPARNDLAFALASLGRDLQAAQEHAETALRLQPGNPDFQLTLARVLLARGDPARAASVLQDALRGRPQFPAARALAESLAAGAGPRR